MLVTPEANRLNRNRALVSVGLMALLFVVVGRFFPPFLMTLILCPLCYWLLRRRCLRRLSIMGRPFPAEWEKILEGHVIFFQSLPDPEKVRFRQLVKIFLDEIRITGIRTEVDDTVRLLVAASAIIPIFGFHDWEYHRLGEVLIYPESFDEKYQTTGNADENILGMVGLKHLSGVMILSKPSLLAGFDNPIGADNVGIHEFVHLIEQEELEHGLPTEVPWESVRHWVQYVAKELAHPAKNHAYFKDYAYTNDQEFLAVLAEYFFKSPELLQKKDPELYGMLREMFHQDTRSILNEPNLRRQKYDRNSPCPCGSGKKYKQCCLLKGREVKSGVRSSNNTDV